MVLTVSVFGLEGHFLSPRRPIDNRKTRRWELSKGPPSAENGNGGNRFWPEPGVGWRGTCFSLCEYQNVWLVALEQEPNGRRLRIDGTGVEGANL